MKIASTYFGEAFCAFFQSFSPYLPWPGNFRDKGMNPTLRISQLVLTLAMSPISLSLGLCICQFGPLIFTNSKGIAQK